MAVKTAGQTASKKGSVKVTVDIDTGATEVAALGMSGPSCISATKKLEEDLGVTVSDQKTGDFHKAAKVGNTANA